MLPKLVTIGRYTTPGCDTSQFRKGKVLAYIVVDSYTSKPDVCDTVYLTNTAIVRAMYVGLARRTKV